MPRKPNSSPQTRTLLAAFLGRAHAWRYGYDLTKETGLRSGTLYPLLIRLTEQRLLEARWESSDHTGLPPRHIYRLTGTGIAVAEEQRRSQEVSALDGYAGVIS